MHTTYADTWTTEWCHECQDHTDSHELAGAETTSCLQCGTARS